MKTLYRYLTYLLCATLLASCAGSGTPPPPPSPTAIPPSATPLPPSPTSTPTETPYPTAPGPDASNPPPSLDGGLTIPYLTPGEPITISSIEMFSATEGWAVGGITDPGKHILRTQDGGVSWVDVTPPQEDVPGETPLVFFYDADFAWVVYIPLDYFDIPAGLAIWFTDNGGETWQISAPLDTAVVTVTFIPTGFTFADVNHGWLLVAIEGGMNHQYSVLYRTDDGGTSWEKVLDPYSDDNIQGCHKSGMAFADAQAGFLTLDCSGVVPGAQVHLTLDGGLSWQPLELPVGTLGIDEGEGPAYCLTHSPNTNIRDLLVELTLVLECKTIHAGLLQEQSYLAFTSNFGVDWQITPGYPGGDLVQTQSGDWLAFNGSQLYTIDAGLQNFSLAREMNWEGQFSFINAREGWAVARSEGETALVHTTDTGEHWEIIEPVTAP